MRAINNPLQFKHNNGRLSEAKRAKLILRWSIDVFCKRTKAISQQEWLRIVAKELPKKDLSLIDKIKAGLQKLKFLGQ